MSGSGSSFSVRSSSAHARAVEAAAAGEGRPSIRTRRLRSHWLRQYPFVWTLPETVKLCEESGPNIGVTLDAWHWYHSGGTVADIQATNASRIVHVHVSDAREMPPEAVEDNMRLLPGEGIIDLVGFFTALQKIGYQGGIAPETIGPRIPDSMPADESARLALEMTAGVMKKAGVMP